MVSPPHSVVGILEQKTYTKKGDIFFGWQNDVSQKMPSKNAMKMSTHSNFAACFFFGFTGFVEFFLDSQDLWSFFPSVQDWNLPGFEGTKASAVMFVRMKTRAP